MLGLRRVASIIAAAIIATIAFSAPSATADTVTVKYQCSPGAMLWYYDWLVTIEAPAVATHGQPITLNVSMELVDNPRTETLPAHSEGTYLDIVLGGASTGSVTTTTMWNPEIPVGGQLRVEGGTAQVTPANVGNLTYTPSKFVWVFVFSGGGAALYCFNRTGFPPPVSATTRVV